MKLSSLLGLSYLFIFSGQLFAAPDIIGGKSPKEKPLILQSTVAIITEIKGKLVTFCSGTVINSSTVITAAHCLAGITSGDLYISYGEVAAENERIRVSSFKYYYQDYFQAYWGNGNIGAQDIGLLLTEKPLPMTPVKIGSPLEINEDTGLLLAGYGVTSIEADESTDLDMENIDTGVLYYLNSSTFASLIGPAVSLNEKKDLRSAGGDSGGPLYTRVADSLILHGVLSNGSESDSESETLHMSEYSHPGFFVQWMNCALPEDQKIKAPLGIEFVPCDGVGFMDVSKLGEFNEQQCQQQRPGFTITDYGCFPGNQTACESFKEEVGAPVLWDEETQKCEIKE